MFFKKVAELFAYQIAYQRAHISIPEFLFRLPLKLRLRQFYGNNNSNSFQNIIAGQFIRIRLDDVILFAVIIDHAG